jgi:predicted dehydrogenase
MSPIHQPIGVAVLGVGYWGPNLIRNLTASPAFDLRWICDLDPDRAHAALGRYTTIKVSDDLDAVLDDPRVSAVVIATPANTHHRLALKALRAGRHVLVEKPLADSSRDGMQLVAEAEHRGLVLMCDHTFCYTPAATWIRRAVYDGRLGEIRSLSSTRVALGLVRPDIDVFWDLAPHDLSLLDFLLPAELAPTSVAAFGSDPLGIGRAAAGHLVLTLANEALARVEVSWLSPAKIRTVMLGGSRSTVCWDDQDAIHPVLEHTAMIDLDPKDPAGATYHRGAMTAPQIDPAEPLKAVIAEYAAAIAEQRPALTDGRAGVRVLNLLDAAGASLAAGGRPIPVTESGFGNTMWRHGHNGN